LEKKTQTDQPGNSPKEQDSTTWKESPFLLIKGFLMGSADIVPGVSGGTMALIVGIYSRLIHAIKSFDTRFVKNLLTFRLSSALSGVHWRFMMILLTGILSAILFFTKVVPLQVYMFTDPELIYGLFFGLIVGSIVILIKALDSFGWWHAFYVLLGTLIGFWVVTLVPTDTSESAFFVFISGSIAICAMVLPGISGSYILLILRKYDYILSQVGKLGTVETGEGLLMILPFVLGAITGLALFTRLLSWLLDNYYVQTIAVLIGFLIGSLYVIWPYQDRSYEEFVTETEIIEYTGERAVALRENPPETNRPTYQRLGEIVNPNANYDELKQVELETVKKKLVKTDPYIPYINTEGAGTEHFGLGMIGMAIGLILVIGLDFLRKWN
jgi:putative membrane protein